MPQDVNMNSVLEELNRRSQSGNFNFGRLQDLRKEHKKLVRRPSLLPFPSTTKEDWAHHVGARSEIPEIQFNVGIDDGDFRWGIAVSLEPSQSLPDPVEMMYPKLQKLNQFLENYSEYFNNRGYVMWEYNNRIRNSDRAPQPVSVCDYEKGDFLFLGKHEPFEYFNADRVLHDFDQLFPLYEFVEFKSEESIPMLSEPCEFAFAADPTPSNQTASHLTSTREMPSEISVSFRHQYLQAILKKQLSAEPGIEVATELEDGRGGYIDLVVRRGNDELEFYEIKTGSSAKLCVRDALGQILEYAYRPPSIQIERLFVAGEAALDCDTKEYLRLLREDLRIPIYYWHVVVPDS